MSVPNFDDLEPDDDDEESGPEITPEMIEMAKDKADKLESAARKIGLYQQSYRLMTSEDPDTGEALMVLMVDFIPGDIAFSPKVMDPETHQIDKEFRAIATGTEEDEFEAYRRQLANKLENDGEEE